MNIRHRAWRPEEDAYIVDNARQMTDEEIGFALRRSKYDVQDRRISLGVTRQRQIHDQHTTHWLPGEPTPEEIKAACAKIQATWSAYERRMRSAYGRTSRVEVKQFVSSIRGGGICEYRQQQ